MSMLIFKNSELQKGNTETVRERGRKGWVGGRGILDNR